MTAEQRKAQTQARTEQALQGFLDLLKSGDFPKAVARTAIITRVDSAPSAKWSPGNQMLMIQAGTGDARGYRQWQDVGRQVKKGTKALYIIHPRVIQVENEDTKEKEPRVVGFGFTPVFGYEDTEGEPIAEYGAPVKLPPLWDVAQEMGIPTSYAPTNHLHGGFYQFTFDTAGDTITKRIVLCTREERTFFHELAHAAHHALVGTAEFGSLDAAHREIVAETAAAALAELYGKEYKTFSPHYIKGFTEDKDPLKAVLAHVADVRRVLDFILAKADELEQRLKAS